MNTLEVSLHGTIQQTSGASTMNTQGRWGGITHVDGNLETQSLPVRIDAIYRAPQCPQWNEETTAEDRCHLTQPLLGEIFQLEGGAR